MTSQSRALLEVCARLIMGVIILSLLYAALSDASEADYTVYVQAGKNQTDFDADSYACQQDAAAYAGTRATAVPMRWLISGRRAHYQRFYDCMTIRHGWTTDVKTHRGHAKYGSAT